MLSDVTRAEVKVDRELCCIHSDCKGETVAPARGRQGGGKGGGCPPMLKKVALVILPNSMRKLGWGAGIHLRCEKTINIIYF